MSNFQISGESLIKETGHHFRKTHDIDINLELVTKLNERNKKMSKKLDDVVMSK